MGSLAPGAVLPAGSLTLQQAAIPARNTFLERFVFRWDCASECSYNCMCANEAWRSAQFAAGVSPPHPRSLRPPKGGSNSKHFTPFKYHGKWPFVRILGCQELFSSLFSVFNALPHIVWFFRLRSEFGPVGPWALRRGVAKLPMLALWSAYSVVYLNTWVWSAVFHARDTILTERLDYFCASMGLSFSLAVVVLRMLGSKGTKAPVRAIVFGSVFSALLVHIGYLQLIHFDYGWNMRVSLTVGMIHTALWLAFCVREWRNGVNQKRMVAVNACLWAAACLEVFDFPPIASGLLDAHAIWHGLTPLIGWQFYRWVHDDLTQQAKLQEQENIKRV